jgi:hypothetical protein
VALDTCDATGAYLPQSYPGRVLVQPGVPTELAPAALTAATTAQTLATERAYERVHPAAAASYRPLIKGTVRSEAGRPLAGICVTLAGYEAASSAVQGGGAGFSMVSQTGRGGHYELASLLPGKNWRWRVLFTGGCGNTGNYAPQWWRRSATSTGASVLRQTSAGTTFAGIDARLTPGGALTGVVRGGSATGPGVSGACVQALGRGGQAGVHLSTVSGSGGRYRLSGLGTGRYVIRFTPGCGARGNFLATPFTRLRARAGRTIPGVNGFLPDGAIISGTVTSGTAGGPTVRGICVTLVDSQANSSSATTSGAGTYSFRRLAPGSYYLYFAGGCGSSGSYAPQYFDAQAGSGAARRIDVGYGSVATADAAMLPGGTISGTITSQRSGLPLRGMCATAFSQQQTDDEVEDIADVGAFAFFPETVAASPDGAYRVVNLSPGLYLISLGPCSSMSYAPAWFAPEGGALPQWVSVGAGQVTAGVSVGLPRAGAVSGRITAVLPGGRIRGVAGIIAQPLMIGGVSDQFGDTVALLTLPGGLDFHSGNNGAYAVPGLAPGRYTVQFEPSMFAPFGTQWYKDKRPGQAPTPVTVRSGRTTPGIDGTLRLGTLVSGTVIAASSRRPVADACVIAAPAGDGSPLSFANILALRIGSGGPSGRFTLGYLTPGLYRVAVSPCEAASPAGIEATIRVPARRSVILAPLALPAPGRITGTVSAPAADGGGQGDCVVATPVSGNGALTEIAVGASGKYAVTGLAPGRYQVTFTSACGPGNPGLASQAGSTVAVSAGRATVVNAVLAEVGSIEGTVTAAGSPVPGECAAAYADAAATAPAAVAITGAGGSYQLGFLAPGSYIVKFSTGCGDAGYATQWWNGTATGATGAASAAPVTVAAAAASPDVNGVLAK